MGQAGDVGQYGEDLARAWLEERGFIHVASRWSCPMGEIDLIMRESGDRRARRASWLRRNVRRSWGRGGGADSCLVFVEVRVRARDDFGHGAATVVDHKQRKLIRAAQYFQQQTGYWGNCRFDVVSISLPKNQEPEIEHIEHAFTL